MKKVIVVLILLSGSHGAWAQAFFVSGTTPCNRVILDKLKVPADAPCEFMRWRILLDEAKDFTLSLSYGEYQPGSLLFKNGGKTLEIKGNMLTQNTGSGTIIYELSSPELKSHLLLKRFDRHIFHLLDDQKKLLRGDGGLSFTLNKVER